MEGWLKTVAHIRMEQSSYLEIRDTLMDLNFEARQPMAGIPIQELSFEPYAPVRRQAITIFTRVNRARNRAAARVGEQQAVVRADRVTSSDLQCPLFNLL